MTEPLNQDTRSPLQRSSLAKRAACNAFGIFALLEIAGIGSDFLSGTNPSYVHVFWLLVFAITWADFHSDFLPGPKRYPHDQHR